MKCSKCRKTYDDQLSICPFCGYKNKIFKELSLSNRILNIINSKTVLSFICVIAGGLMVLTYLRLNFFESSVDSKESFELISAASKSLSGIPNDYDWSKYLSIYVAVVSLFNLIKEKELEYSAIAIISAVNAITLMSSSKIFNLIRSITNINISSLYSSMSSYSNFDESYHLLKNPEKLVETAQSAAGWGSFLFIMSLMLFFYFMNKPHNYKEYNVKVIDSIQEKAVNTYENIKPQTKDHNVIHCVKCGGTIKANMKFCPSCGAPVIIEKQKNHCKKCGKEFDKDMNFCPYCGAKIRSSMIDTKAMQEELLRRSGKKLCKSCGKAFKIEMNFCPFCGEKYDKKIVSSNTSFVGDHSFFKNYYVQLFSKVGVLAKFGIAVGGLLSVTLILVYGIASTMSGDSFSSAMNSIQTMLNMFKVVPIVYYVALIICIFICVFSVLHLVKDKNKRVFLLSLVSGINAFLLLGCSNTIKMIRGIYSLDLSDAMEGDISSSLVNSAGRFLQDPEQAMKDLTIAFGFGFILLGYCIYLHIQCKKNNSQ